MNEKTIAAIALSNRDFPTFADKLNEAVSWFELAALQGADLVVLPEAINFYKGDGPNRSLVLTRDQAAFDDWQQATAPLIDAAIRLKTAVTIPVITREDNGYINSFFLVDKDGEIVGQYVKACPTSGEIAEGVCPGKPLVIEWDGLKVGGAICFDCYFPEVWDVQAGQGADIFLMPSMTGGGTYLNFYAMHHGVPVVLAYSAWSRIIDMTGKSIAEIGYRNETLSFGFGVPIAMATLNFDRVSLYGDCNQDKMIDIQRKYGKRVQVIFDQEADRFILESRCADLMVDQIMKDFELIAPREYFQESKPSFSE